MIYINFGVLVPLCVKHEIFNFHWDSLIILREKKCTKHWKLKYISVREKKDILKKKVIVPSLFLEFLNCFSTNYFWKKKKICNTPLHFTKDGFSIYETMSYIKSIWNVISYGNKIGKNKYWWHMYLFFF